MAVVEYRQHAFSATTGHASVLVVTTAGVQVGATLIVPRNMKIELERIHGSYASHIAPGAGENTAEIGIRQGGTTFGGAVFRSNKLWSALISHHLTGTPNNLSSTKDGVQLDSDLSGRLGTSSKSVGTRSNAVHGWICAAITSNTNMNILIDIIVEYKMTWLGNSGSKADIDMEFTEGENI